MNKTKVISFINYKGGVGRSTAVLNLAKAFSKVGKKVLAIDLDPKADLTYSCIYKHDYSKNVYNLFNELDLDLINVIKNTKHDFDIVPSGTSMDNLEFSLATSKEYVPHKRLKHILKSNAKDSYDYVLIDTPSFPSIININAITVSDFIIIPITLDYNCINAIELLYNTFKNVALISKTAFLINKYDKRESLNNEILKKFHEKFYREHFLTNYIKTDCKYKLLLDRQETIFDIEPPRGKGQVDFKNLSSELIQWFNKGTYKIESYNI